MKTNMVFVLFALSAALVLSSCDKEVSTSESSAAIEMGKIIIESNPAGAQIFLDGDNTAKTTPAEFPHMNSADYNILLKKNFFYDTMFTVHLEHDEEEYILIDYLADPNNFAQIEYISQPPGALIFLDDSCTNLYTPNTLQYLFPGTHKIKLTYPEHRADSVSIDINMRSKKSVSMVLQDTTVWVDYTNFNSGFPTYRDLSSVLVDANNTKWIGTKGVGLVKYNNSEWERYSYNSVISSSWVEQIEVDRTGKIWIGTTKGIRTYQNGIWNSIESLDGLNINNDFIERISIDNDNNIWIGGFSNQLSHYFMAKYDGNEWAIIANEWFWSFAVDRNRIAWAYFRGGLKQFDGTNWNPVVTGIDEVDNLPICFLKTDRQDNLWIAAHDYNTERGALYIYDGQNYNKIDVPYTGITGICFTQEGTTWISTKSGLIKLDANYNFTYYTNVNSGIMAGTIWDVAVESNGDVWIATDNNGLIKFKTRNL